MEAVNSLALDWGVAVLTAPGESACGDVYVVQPFTDGVLVAVLDGVGHGPEAAAAAQIATGILAAQAEESIVTLLQHCHEALRGTRGAVISIASINVSQGLIWWLGVGNVQGILRRRGRSPSDEFLLLRAGVVGAQLPMLQPAVFPVSTGDILVFATDGIKGDFTGELAEHHSPQRAAEDILARYATTTDDALVLVARYLGRRA